MDVLDPQRYYSVRGKEGLQKIGNCGTMRGLGLDDRRFINAQIFAYGVQAIVLFRRRNLGAIEQRTHEVHQ